MPISELDPRPLIVWTFIVAVFAGVIVWCLATIWWIRRAEGAIALRCGHSPDRWDFEEIDGGGVQLRCRDCEAER